MTHPAAVHAIICVCVLLLVHLAYGGTIKGRIVLPDTINHELPVDAYATLFSSRADNTHRRRKALANHSSGSFSFAHVADGVYSLDIEAMPFVFSAVQVTVQDGVVKQALASDVGDAPLPVDLDEGIKMVPLRVLSFFEQRQNFSLMSWLKTPYGAMIGFAVFSLVIMPYLKVDPEEYRQMKRELAQMTSGGGTGEPRRSKQN